jgi:rifampicin phosphotransferase
LKQSDEWNDYVNADDSDLSTLSAAIKKKAVAYDYTDEQKFCLDTVLEQLSNKKMGLYAVRSSSPEEDLAGASFAGGYETVLGVTGSTMNDAIREVFVSSLDERIYHYKVQHGFDPFNPNIAVIIQDQIASEIAGVAFSINPINNCFDEAAINANFGLGETVVSGKVTPDTFIVDKISKEILSKTKGEKGISIYLNPDGGTVTRDSEKDELSLSDTKVFGVCDLLEKVEYYFNKPIDMEWAIVKDKFFVLQARPITAYITLAEEMLTKPGEQKKLYLDTFITQQGNSNPFSVLGLDVYELAQKTAYKKTMGSESFIDREEGLAFNCGGRSYLNLSNYFKVAGKKQSIRLFKSQDILSYKIIMELDIKHYVTPKTPPGLKGFIFKMMIGGISSLKPMMRAYRKPTEYKELLLQEAKDLTNGLNELYNADLPFHTFVDKTNDIVTHFNFEVSLGAILATEIAKMNLKKLFKNMSDSIKESIIYLEQALPDNITIEMGLAMFKLACSPEITQCENGAQFNEQLGDRTFSKQFLQAWDTFIEEYGFRCPGELDLAVSRFSDTPELFF